MALILFWSALIVLIVQEPRAGDGQVRVEADDDAVAHGTPLSSLILGSCGAGSMRA